MMTHDKLLAGIKTQNNTKYSFLECKRVKSQKLSSYDDFLL